MISPVDRIRATSLTRRIEATNRGIISQEEDQIKPENVIPLINDLEIQDIFKDEDREGGDSVTDLIYRLVDLLVEEVRNTA